MVLSSYSSFSAFLLVCWSVLFLVFFFSVSGSANWLSCALNRYLQWGSQTMFKHFKAMFSPDIFKLFAALVAVLMWIEQLLKGEEESQRGCQWRCLEVRRSCNLTAWDISFKLLLVLDIIVTQKIHFGFPMLVVIRKNLETLRWASVSFVGRATFDLMQRRCCRLGSHHLLVLSPSSDTSLWIFVSIPWLEYP